MKIQIRSQLIWIYTICKGRVYPGSAGLGLLTLVLLNQICPAFANSVDPDQLASEEANWSGSALFAIQYFNSCQENGSSNLISWKLEVGVAS